MQGVTLPITCGKALTCADLHGLERGRERPVENWTPPFIRGKACRGQGAARDHDEWRPVEGESDETGVGAVSRVQSFPTSLHLPRCGAWPPCGGGEWEHQFSGDSGREGSNRHEGSRSRETGPGQPLGLKQASYS